MTVFTQLRTNALHIKIIYCYIFVLSLIQIINILTRANPESYIRGGPNLITFFFLLYFFLLSFFSWWEGRGSKYRFKWVIIGPPAQCHLNGVHWRADDGPALNAGLVALWFFRGSGPILQKKIYIFCVFFSGDPDQYCKRNPIFLWFFMGMGGSGPRGPVSPSGSTHAKIVE